MKVDPSPEHKWLQKLLGEWRFRHESPAPPGQEPCNHEGTETVRAIGDIWIQAEGRGQMPGGGEAVWLLTLGYDPQKQRFVGTWLGSMMTWLWVYEGRLSDNDTRLTLETEGPKMTPEGLGEGTTRYREVLEFKSDNHRTFTTYMQGDDGKWVQIMTADYHRA